MEKKFDQLNPINEIQPKTLEEANEVIKNLKEQYLGLKKRFNRTLIWLGASAILMGGVLVKTDIEKETEKKDKLEDLKATIYKYQESAKSLDRLKDEKEPPGEVYQSIRDAAYQQAYADLNNADSHIRAIFNDLGIHLNPDDK